MYLLLFSLLSFAAFIYYPTKYKYLGVVFTGFVLAIFVALRASWIAPDFEIYEEWYENRFLAGSSFVERSGIFSEPLYFTLNDLFNYLGAPFRLFILFLSIFSVTAKLCAICSITTSRIGITVGFFSYLVSVFILNDFIQFRVASAIAFLYIGILFLVNNKRYAFILMVISASLFHSSALLLILLLIPLNGKKSAVYDTFLVALSILLVLLLLANCKLSVPSFLLSKFDSRIDLYVNIANKEDNTTNSFAINFLLALVICFSMYSSNIIANVFYKRKGVFDSSPVAHMCFRAIVLGYIILLFTSDVPAFSLRLFQLFSSCIPLLIGCIWSQQNLKFEKCVSLIWIMTIVYINFFREPLFVHPYDVFF